MRYAFVQIRFLGIQPSIWISAGQPLYLFFFWSEWFIFSFWILSGSLKPLAAIKTQLDLNFIFFISLLPSSSINFLASFFNLVLPSS